MKRVILSILISICLFQLSACNKNSDSLNLNSDDIVKIQQLETLGRLLDMVDDVETIWVELNNIGGELTGAYKRIANTFSDETYIANMVDFFNALTLTADADGFVTANAPAQIFRIVYNDETVDIIQFHWTALFYNGLFFHITNEYLPFQVNQGYE